MKYLDFEKHIKKELEGSKEHVQMDALLASLDLGKEPKSKGFALWMIIPFLIAIASVLAWNSYTLEESGGQATYSSEQMNNQKQDNQKVLTSEIEAISESTGTEDKTLEESEGNTNSELNSSLSNNTLSTTEINTTTKTQTTKKLKTSSKENTPAIENQPITPYQSQQLFIENEVIENTSLNSSYIQKNETASAIKSNDSENKAFEPLSPSMSRGLLSIAGLESSPNMTMENESEVDGNLFSRMKINCPSFNNASWHMALIPEVGIFVPMKTLENNSLEEPDAFNERINSESTLEGLELGLYGMLVRDNVPFYIKAGVSYSRISERMDLKYEYTEMDTTIGIISSSVSSNGDTITHIYGDIITETTFKGSNRQHYYIHLFDIPISVGYTTYVAGLDIGIEAGVKVNFMTRATGNLLTSKSEYTNLSLNKLYKNRIGVNYFGGLMVGRNFGRYGDIYVAPRFTYFPDSFNNADNPITQRYFNIGINAGIVYKIN